MSEGIIINEIKDLAGRYFTTKPLGIFILWNTGKTLKVMKAFTKHQIGATLKV